MPGTRKIVALFLAVLMLYAFKSMISLILITFIITYLVNRLHQFVIGRTSRFFRLNRVVSVILIYVVIISLLTLGIYRYIPMFIAELTDLVNTVISFYKKPPMNLPDNFIVTYLLESLQDINVASYINSGFDFLVQTLSDIGKWSLNLFIAIILSFFFMLEKEKLTDFTKKFRESKASYFFTEFEYFGKKFVFSFGKVIEVQFMISLINSILSTLFLWLFGFSNLFALGIMIFILGMVPVIGVVVSLIPLCAIAFKIGGMIKIVYVLLMIALVHGLETYILNPKLMSSKTHLPIFYTFTILLVSEHFFGVWGLIVGVPVFMFLLDILEVPVGVLPKAPEHVAEE